MTLYRRNRDGFLVEVTHYDTVVVECHPQGGGFRLQLPRQQFDAQYSPASELAFRPGVVGAEFLPEGLLLPCYSDGRRWNGWGMPYFPRASVDQLVKIAAEDKTLHPISWSGDRSRVVVLDDDFEGGVYTLEPTTMPDGTPAWPVGAGGWCWDAVTVIPTLAEQVESMKVHILSLIRDGILPNTISCFGDLDSYIDANCLGGLCEDELFDALIAHFGGRDEHEGMPQGMLDFIRAAEDEVDAWLKTRFANLGPDAHKP